MIPPQWDAALCDGTVAISDDEAIATARALAREEGILAGYSTGANVAAALKVAAGLPPNGSVATVASDTGTRYLSGNLFSEPERPGNR